ncbi:SUKH-4 family immunity protein [Streptomyces sp. NPDC001443]
MINADSLAAAFSPEGTPITMASPEQVNGKVLNEAAKRILTEVGIPEQLTYEIFFRDIGSELITMRDFIRRLGKFDTTEVDDFFLIGSGPNSGTILLDGATGNVISWSDPGTRMINSSLDKFVEFLQHIQLNINDFEDRDWPDEERTEGYLHNFSLRLEEIDPEPFPQARDYWEVILRAIFLLPHE